MAGEEAHRKLLESVVTAARAIFESRAASVSLLDAETGELVFEAVAGEGAKTLPTRRFPATEGVAGFVVSAGQSLVVDDLEHDPRFARELARDTGYVPRSLIAAPLLDEDRVLGVISILDRDGRKSFGLRELELLELFAHQAACAVVVVQAVRRARLSLAETDGMAAFPRLATQLKDADPERKKAALRLLDALADLTES